MVDSNIVSKTVDSIKNELMEAFRERCLKSDMGFQDTDSNGKWDIPWTDIISRIDVSYRTEDNEICNISEAYFAVFEVGVELDYDGMSKISEVGDKVLYKYDKDAYFDFDSPGILVAYVTLDQLAPVQSSKSIKAGRDYIPDITDIYPEGFRTIGPDPDEYEYEAEIEVDIDAVILLEKDGSWEYEDTTYPWAKSDRDSKGNWYAETDYGDVYIGDPTTIVENIDDLLEVFLPMKEGRYHIQGYADLFYDISNILGNSTFLGMDEDNSPLLENEYFLDDADVSFNFSKSSINDFNIEKLK